MRAHALLVAALALFLVPVDVAAQSTPLEMQVLEDGSGDQAVQVEDEKVPDPAAWTGLDLLGLLVAEKKDELTFTLQVQDVTSGGREGVFHRYDTHFVADDTPYRATTFTDGSNAGGYLYEQSGEGRWYVKSEIFPTVDAASDSIVFDVPREDLLNSLGSAPRPGWHISGFWTASRSITINGCCSIMGQEVPVPDMVYGDRMPDEGTSPLPYEIQLGMRQQGHALLLSPSPTRSSNGEAATFVFDVRAHNTGPEDDRFELVLRGAPASWEVQVPTPIIEIPAGGNLSVPVIVSTPFAHKHGSYQPFRLEMHSLSDPQAIGRIELGIRYTEVPQPTGHHDTVWFHSEKDEMNEFGLLFGTVFGFDGTSGYMNAAEEDSQDSGDPVPAWRMVRGDPASQEFLWRLWLKPGLDMGIDWDLTRTGTLMAPIQVQAPIPGATLSAELVYEGPPDEEGTQVFVLGRAASVDPVDIDGRHTFELVLEGLPEADFLRWQPDASLRLDLRLQGTGTHTYLGPTDLVPKLEGGHLQMPLNEYRDPVDDLYSSIQALAIHVDGAQERLANPDTSVVFEIDLVDHGSAHGTYDLVLSGTNAAWGQVLGAPAVQVAKDGTQRVAVGITVPADARDGDVADLVLQVTNRADPSVQTLARLLVEVDTAQEHPDDTQRMLEMQGLTGVDEDAPGAPLGLLSAGVAVALYLARRR